MTVLRRTDETVSSPARSGGFRSTQSDGARFCALNAFFDIFSFFKLSFRVLDNIICKGIILYVKGRMVLY